MTRAAVIRSASSSTPGSSNKWSAMATERDHQQQQRLHRRLTVASGDLERSNSRGNSLIRSRIQRRRNAEGRNACSLRRSLSCDDVKYLRRSTSPAALESKTLADSDRPFVRMASDPTPSVSPVVKATTPAPEKKQRRKRVRDEAKPRTRRHTKTLTFPANSLLHFAVVENDETLTERLLTDTTSNVDQLSVDGTAPLHEAAMNGSLPCVGILIKHGAHVDIADCGGHTPLEYAVFAGQFDTAAKLIECGANVDKIKDGLTL